LAGGGRGGRRRARSRWCFIRNPSATPLEEWRGRTEARWRSSSPDGTWAQATRIPRASRRAPANRVRVAARFAERQAPAHGAVSASDGDARGAGALALGILEGPEVEAALLRVYRIMTERTLWTNGRIATARRDRRNPGRAVRQARPAVRRALTGRCQRALSRTVRRFLGPAAPEVPGDERFALVLSVVAALFFTFGGVFMKLSSGFTRLGAGAAALALFVAGAVAQTFALKYAELGVAYVFVLGLEAVAGLFVIGRVFLRPEGASLWRTRKECARPSADHRWLRAVHYGCAAPAGHALRGVCWNRGAVFPSERPK
jgi:small multidrug resistance pump/quaternary ammonium compound-resistance protein SugE